MAVKILETGNLPEERVYRARCSKCQTLFEFKRADAQTSRDQRDPGLFVTCPLPKCGTEIWKNAWGESPVKYQINPPGFRTLELRDSDRDIVRVSADQISVGFLSGVGSPLGKVIAGSIQADALGPAHHPNYYRDR